MVGVALFSIAVVYALACLGDHVMRLHRDTDPWSPR
jgi:hypothetical protein